MGLDGRVGGVAGRDRPCLFAAQQDHAEVETDQFDQGAGGALVELRRVRRAALQADDRLQPVSHRLRGGRIAQLMERPGRQACYR